LGGNKFSVCIHDQTGLNGEGKRRPPVFAAFFHDFHRAPHDAADSRAAGTPIACTAGEGFFAWAVSARARTLGELR